MENRIEKVIRELIGKDTDKMQNEREVHYEFFKLLCDEFEKDELRECFRWELPTGPIADKGSKPGAIDMAMYVEVDRFIAIEIEFVSPGVALEKELDTCINKLRKSELCNDQMVKGYIVPLLVREGDKKARGYSKKYSELCGEILDRAENKIRGSRIRLIREGVKV
jgi:hypothetical protein